MKKAIRLCLLLALAPLAYIYYQGQTNHTQVLILSTPYGEVKVTEPVVADLIAAPAMQRLKHIHQYGISYYITDMEEFSRYDHSIGVFALLRKFKASLKEQIAGLLHDTSHTVFSHVGDFLYKNQDEGNSYQDDIHGWHLSKSGLGKVLKKHGLTIQDVMHKNKNFQALEKELPNMCADRIEYNLQGGLKRKILTQQDVNDIVSDLRLENGTWYFNNPSLAKKFANISLYLTQNLWGTPKGILEYKLTSKAMHRAMEIGLITKNEILFSTDKFVLNRLKKSDDPLISKYMKTLHTYKGPHLTSADKGFKAKTKFRGINPLVKTDSGLKRLTEIDPKFKIDYMAVKNSLALGWYITKEALA